MADYTPERIEALAEFFRLWHGRREEDIRFVSPGDTMIENAARLGLVRDTYELADWLRPEDWADKAAREAWDVAMGKSLGRTAECKVIAAIIRRHAEDRT